MDAERFPDAVTRSPRYMIIPSMPKMEYIPSPSWNQDSELGCTFCRIIRSELPSFRVFEDENVLAILDILPLRKGHTLVIPKVHCSRLSELPPEYAAATGQAVTKVAHALTEALGNSGLNVVCNQEYAQAVPHVHYHIIPAPVFNLLSTPESLVTSLSSSSPNVPTTVKEMHQKEFESREELHEDDARVLVKKILARL